MRFDLIELTRLTLPRKERFTIARGSSDVAKNVFVVVHAGNGIGYGSGASSEVTAGTAATITAAVQTLGRSLEGFEFEGPRQVADQMDKILPGIPARRRVKAECQAVHRPFATSAASHNKRVAAGGIEPRSAPYQCAVEDWTETDNNR